ncbi:Oidioi.mRNA.OKI2018_I69.PAR.g10217.t1.cds [Oikopleura dioica]|uniref:DNA replication complex GINS protein PSF3 n=1 Tax=Oikopleura dioica TaxID=34765 RepID=A0ABN7RPJ5_OIKDI|nr:Oidioi.mRNA.OKI2018_I69.PAR.g10217.t1.cds [Oikopleura dioica]
MSDLGIVDDQSASYLDIDDILMTENKISCRARYDLVDLELRRTAEDFHEGKKVDLPIWMAMRLNEFFRHEIPKQYNTHFQGILNADPEVVNLHKEGPKYFAMGLQLTSENFDFADDEDIINMCQTLLQASARRVSWISDMAAADHYQQSKVDSKLDDMEKEMYAKAISERKSWEDWTRGMSNRLTESKFIAKSRKRKRDALAQKNN